MYKTASRIAKHISLHGPSADALNDMLLIADNEDMTAEQRREICTYVRQQARKLMSDEGLDIIFRAYCISGRDSFDDYMSACEFYRAPNARFWWPRRKILEGKHHIATQIQDFIDDPYSLYLGFSLGPGTGKTTLIKFLLAYIMGKFPQSANMYCSYSSGMVKMVLDSERAILTDTDEYRHNSVFPDNGFPEISSEYSYLTFRGKGDAPTLSLVSIGGSVTGRTRANKFLVTDDLVKDAEEARSPERLANLYNDYKSTLTTREIGDKVKEIQLGTRWSVHDPIGRMQADHEGDDRYRFIAIPIMDENGESNFEYEHPDNYTKEKIMQIKASLDPVDFSCLYMQKGIEKEGLALPAESLQYYNGVLPPGEPDRKLFFVDVAFGGGDSLSMPICYKYGDTGYVVDVVFDKSAKDITMPRVIGKIKQHGLQMGRFEANNGGDFFAEDVDKQLRADGYHCNITSKRASGHSGKLARIEQYVPDIKRLYFLEAKYRDNEYRKFMDEATTLSFTAKNLHDDAADSLAGLCEYGFEKPKMVQAYKRLF